MLELSKKSIGSSEKLKSMNIGLFFREPIKKTYLSTSYEGSPDFEFPV